MSMNVGAGGGLNADINVTPLVDVVLVLLIIFMVVTPLTQRGYDIDIPRETDTIVPQSDPTEQVILAINETDCPIIQPLGVAGLPPNCMVKINKDLVKLADLPTRMGEIFKNRKADKKILFIAAQEKLNYEGVVRIIDLARSGADDLRLGIVTDEKLAMGTTAPGG